MAQTFIMQTKVSGTLAKQQARYKKYFERKLRSSPAFTAVQIVYVNRPLLNTLAADRQASIRYNRLLPLTAGPSEILEVRAHVLATEENKIAK